MEISTEYLSKSVGLLNPPDPVVLGEESTVGIAVEKLRDAHSTGAVLIVAPDQSLCGIFTERDYLKKCSPHLTCSEIPITDVMTGNPETISMQTPLAYALRLMTEGGYRHVPIVDEHNIPVGIVSMREVVYEIVKTFVLPQARR